MEENFDIIECPACGKTMKQIYVSSANVTVDICLDGCGGIYFDNRELNKMDESHENIDEILAAIEGKTFKPQDENKTRICPVCVNPMHKNFSSIKHEIAIDECYVCGGKFLDNEELQKFRAEYKTENDRRKDVLKYISEVVGIKIPKN